MSLKLLYRVAGARRLVAVIHCLVIADLSAQGTHPGSPDTLTAHRVDRAPRIDGRLQDDAWRTVPARDDFVVFAPREGGTPAFRSETRIGYDDDALYIAVRAHDPSPDSIVRRLARRDTFESSSDLILIFLDSWHDRRTGYQFAVSAAGVKFDAALFDDGLSDASWDGVWDSAVTVDSAGWSAEFAIPFQQLRFVRRERPTFGIFIGRWVGRTGERSAIPQYRRSVAGISSQMGTLIGMAPGSSGAVEITPYLRAGSRNVPDGIGPGRRMDMTPSAGGDFKWLPRPSLSLDGTLNPDFGQVEADPAVLNLTGNETFQTERRPFFLEGAGMLNVPLAPDGSGLLFYSRRIGRTPVLASLGGPSSTPVETTILGAARVTGRITPGLSLAALSAVTERERNANGAVIEPSAHYGVARLLQEYRNGRSGIGAMLTRVDRRLEGPAAGLLPRTAQTLFVSTQHQTGGGDWQFAAWGAATDLQGDAAAITERQRSAVHAFQRPDDGIVLDTSRTALTGRAMSASVAKLGGGITRLLLAYRHVTPGFDVNEMGFLNSSGIQRVSASAGLRTGSAGRALGLSWQTAEVNLGFGGEWSTEGERLPLARSVALTATMLLRNLAQVQTMLSTQLRGGYCTIACTRGGPALLDPPRTTAILDVTGDPRRHIVPRINLEYDVDDEGRSHGYGFTADATVHVRSNLDASLSLYAFQADYHWFHYPGQVAGEPMAITVASLKLPSRSLTARTNWTISPEMTLQWYAQAHLSRGTYGDVRQVADPRASDWADRFHPAAGVTGPAGIDYRQFRSNLVYRWEYRPGSTLFLVWSQGRDLGGSEAGDPGLWPGADLRELFATRPDNVLAVKASYRLSR